MLDSSPAACTAKASIVDIQCIKLVDAACGADVQTPPCKTEHLKIVSMTPLNHLKESQPKRWIKDGLTMQKQPLKAFERLTFMYLNLQFSPLKPSCMHTGAEACDGEKSREHFHSQSYYTTVRSGIRELICRSPVAPNMLSRGAGKEVKT